MLDGATTWRIFTRIYLPMASSALVAIFILQATFIWNDLLLGLTLTQSDDVRPIVTTLAGMQSTYGGAQISTVLAAAVLGLAADGGAVPVHPEVLRPRARPRSVLGVRSC